MLGERALFDTTRAKLLYETGIRARALRAACGLRRPPGSSAPQHSTHCPFKGGRLLLSRSAAARTSSRTYEDPKPAAAVAAAATPRSTSGPRWTGWFVEEERGLPAPEGPVSPRRRLRELAPGHGAAGGDVARSPERPSCCWRPAWRRASTCPGPTSPPACSARGEAHPVARTKGEATIYSVADRGVSPDAAWSYEAAAARGGEGTSRVRVVRRRTRVEVGRLRATAGYRELSAIGTSQTISKASSTAAEREQALDRRRPRTSSSRWPALRARRRAASRRASPHESRKLSSRRSSTTHDGRASSTRRSSSSNVYA